MLMKILVTGANGFIGSHLCHLLVNEKHEVYALVRKTSDLTLLDNINPGRQGITLLYGDMRDSKSLEDAIQGKDAVVNLAGVIKGLKQSDYEDTNVFGTLNLLKVITTHNPKIKRIILTSSLAGAGPGTKENPRCEEEHCDSLDGDFYGTSKSKMEKAIKTYRARLPIVIIRPPSVFGPGDKASVTLYGLPKIGLKQIFTGKPRYYSLVYVEDLCRGIIKCLENPKAIGEIFYFASDKPVDWGTLQEIIGVRCFNKKYGSLISLPLPDPILLMAGSILDVVGKITGEPQFLNRSKMIEGNSEGWVCKCDKAKNILGWYPQENPGSIVKKSYDWYAKNGWL
jgi:dihydroflavonol-4-reductase